MTPPPTTAAPTTARPTTGRPTTPAPIFPATFPQPGGGGVTPGVTPGGPVIPPVIPPGIGQPPVPPVAVPVPATTWAPGVTQAPMDELCGANPFSVVSFRRIGNFISIEIECVVSTTTTTSAAPI